MRYFLMKLSSIPSSKTILMNFVKARRREGHDREVILLVAFELSVAS